MEPEIGVGGRGIGEEAGAVEERAHRFGRRRGETQGAAVPAELLTRGADDLDEAQVDLGKMVQVERDVPAFTEDGKKTLPEFGSGADCNRPRYFYDLLHMDPADDAQGHTATFRGRLRAFP